MFVRRNVFASLIAAGLLAGSVVSAQLPAAQQPGRLNDLIPLLEKGVATFGPFAATRSLEGGADAASVSGPDFTMVDMEHNPLDFNQLRAFIQGSIDPAAVLKRGKGGTSRPIIVRLPAYGREMNQWMPKQALDAGANGVMFPHIETVEQAMSAVRAMRFAQVPGVKDFEPNGQRGQGTGWPARVWGLSGPVYEAKADLWPLDPTGELISVLQIENDLGVKNTREILSKVKGITVLFVGPNDLGLYYGRDEEALALGTNSVLAACKEFNVACGITAGPTDVEKKVKAGFRFIITGGTAIDIGKKAAGRTN